MINYIINHIGTFLRCWREKEEFSARAYASNFDNENMQKAIDYSHSYGVKVYVTINTILKDFRDFSNSNRESLSMIRFGL